MQTPESSYHLFGIRFAFRVGSRRPDIRGLGCSGPGHFRGLNIQARVVIEAGCAIFLRRPVARVILYILLLYYYCYFYSYYCLSYITIAYLYSIIYIYIRTHYHVYCHPSRDSGPSRTGVCFAKTTTTTTSTTTTTTTTTTRPVLMKTNLTQTTGNSNTNNKRKDSDM